MEIREILRKLKVGDADSREILTMEETGLPMDLLVLTMTGFGGMSNDAQGEFYFYGEEKPEVFACRVTLVAEVLPENVGPLCTELAVENFTIPTGSLSYDIDTRSVVYNLQVPISDDLTEEEVVEEADICIALALAISVKYAAQYEYYAQRREA